MNYELPIKNIKVNDPFWNAQIMNAVDHVIPYQWRVINDAEPGAVPSHAIKNFKIVAGLEEGEFHGYQFQDSDLAKWMEAASFSLIYKDDPTVREELLEAIELLEKAQQPDGYMDTHFLLKKPDRKWKELAHGHELYVAGHFLEAAVAYYQMTGSDRFLKILEKLVDLIRSIFGKEEGKIDGFPGHEEIELALMKAYRATGDKKYLDLAEYFVLNRGTVTGFRDEEYYLQLKAKGHAIDDNYYQVHLPVVEQTTAEGHSVRAMYLYTAMADIALETGNQQLIDALHALWKNTTGRRMYVTGGLGSQGDGERFTIDYDLPNDRCYTETCAAIGLAMWSLRMLKLEPKVEYADIMERALYNNVLSGISQDGEHYFYVNPLMLKPDVAHYRSDHESVDPSRVKWFGCACCPPNVIRTLTGLGSYVYTQNDNRIYQHLYIGNTANLSIDGKPLTIESTANMPWEGKAVIKISGEACFELALRVPSYAKNFTLTKNGAAVEFKAENGYAVVEAKDGDVYEVSFDMDAVVLCANPRVTEDCGKACVIRGPIVYCAEEVDNTDLLQDFILDPFAPIAIDDSDLFGGIKVLTVSGKRTDLSVWDPDTLYQPICATKVMPASLKLIPYFLWNNRGEGEMTVWMNR